MLFDYNTFVQINKNFARLDKDGTASVGKILSVDKKTDTCILEVHGRKTKLSILQLVTEIYRDGMGAITNPSILKDWHGFKPEKQKIIPQNNNRVFLVTATIAPYTDDGSVAVETVGIFSTSEKAQQAKAQVRNWLNTHGYPKGEVFITPKSIDSLSFYSMAMNI